MKILAAFGRYVILMGKVFSRPEKWSIYYRRVISEMDQLGVGSIPLTAIISIFIGAVITIQMAITAPINIEMIAVSGIVPTPN